ncbi:MAG: hypothetical protein WBR10_06630, partial [Candidatus Acidiferrum sp.]
LSSDELALLLRESYDMIVAKLPKKTREALSRAKPPARAKFHKKSATKSRLRKSHPKTKKPSR